MDSLSLPIFFTVFNQRGSRVSTKVRIFGILALPIVGWLAFFGTERWYGLWGFPLDDAWIHQAYARALAAGEGWSYAGGPPSAGSTSPAWTFLQVPAYWLHVPALIWTNALGMILFAIVLVLTFLITRRLEPAAVWFALLAVGWEWHLVWASLSGMETILFTAWILFVWWICLSESVKPRPRDAFLCGIALGMGLWIRPEALLVLGIAGAYFLWKFISQRAGWAILFLGIGAVLLVSLYAAHNFFIDGRIWPNTWYAKPLEYASLQGLSFLSRLSDSLWAINAGSLALVFWIAWVPCGIAWAKRQWAIFLPVVWAIGHIILYAVQLPVVYQHARYDIPVIPILLMYGVIGIFQVQNALCTHAWARIIIRAWIGSVVAVSLLFLILGARQYAMDVGVIETEMVQASQWIRDHTPQNSRIAAHDVGALGYWGNRQIVDLGGLTEPSAWALLAGKVTVANYLSDAQADYWMTFPKVYSPFTTRCQPIYVTRGSYARLFGETNMAVYKWPEGCSS
jgi:hypothetical protein